MIVQVDPVQSSARVRRFPATVRNPTARQLLVPQDRPRRADPRPADLARADAHVVPFHHWLPSGPPRVMQPAGSAQATAPAQKHALNSAHRLPRSGGTLVHDWLAARQVSASATVPPAESSDELPVVRQNEPVQEMAFSWAGFPLAGSSKSRDQDVPFHWAVTAFWIGSCDCVQVPTAMHLVALAQDTLASPQGPGALPVQKSVCGFHRCQVVPFQDRTSPW